MTLDARPPDAAGAPAADAERARDDHRTDGAVVFGRYALPPNERHYCGPDRTGELLERVSLGAAGPGLQELAREFEGAWPYLELIGDCLHRQPLDPVVVRAYWLGGHELANCGGALFARSLEERFRRRLTRLEFERMSDAVARGAVPDHSFHVFGVYPWVGLLRGGTGGATAPLTVLDRCRIRWGKVVSIEGEEAVVESSALKWDGRRLSLRRPALESARVRREGYSLAGEVQRGDWVSLHWDWVCERLTPSELQRLRRSTAEALAAVATCRYSAPATVLS